ncbi:MAG: VWA domain-containing protein [Gammaproteobacteria bacterium]|nr:MAG: VWA domain-containing protein [Gammaproteobacteria bacterium]
MFVAGCSDAGPRNIGVYLLLDTSGTYTEQLDKAEQIINYTLTRLNGLDSFAVARIDTGSFSEKDIIAKVTFDDRPSAANAQKRLFSETIHTFLNSVRPASHTDITGGLLQAVQFLNEKEPGRKIIFIFSDLKEDLMEGYVRDFPVPMENFEVVALNVTKLSSDNIDPREYLDRLDMWQARVEAEGGSWRVINDLDRLERLL